MDWIGCTITRLDQFLILQFTYFSVRKNNFFGILFAALRSKHYHICTKTEMGNFEDRTKRPVLELPLQSETLTSTFQIMVCFYLFSRMHEMVWEEGLKPEKRTIILYIITHVCMFFKPQKCLLCGGCNNNSK